MTAAAYTVLVPLLVGVACGAPLLLVLGWAIYTYNRLVRQRNQVHASWAQIDVELRRRHDLIPSLVTTVQAYAGHEQAALSAVVTARTRAQHASAGGPEPRADPEHELSSALGQLFARAEAYPQLRADQTFQQLHEQLIDSEDRVTHARQFYNSAAQTLRNSVQAVPSNLVARAGGFRSPPFFAAIGAERDRIQLQHGDPVTGTAR
ncbi:LemA family protein [Natronosporangium hydrolyticum]|uniref:LemA family protein n=1 Tax=Natronosporangium hydrolyticum TaxID=2811111 RepID=A0A895Y9P8_9ACTN|nr:LemA family protein [Natronosporangium hydrolyticum]QSB13035.1 LemA family protein [Natronosporangium hydrolyticum]